MNVALKNERVRDMLINLGDLGRRNSQRFEPEKALINIFVRTEEVKGEVMNISDGGVSILLINDKNEANELAKEISKVSKELDFTFSHKDFNRQSNKMSGKVERVWTHSEDLENRQGLIIKFKKLPVDLPFQPGREKKERLKVQKVLASLDATSVEHYKHCIMNSQNSLFLATFTIIIFGVVGAMMKNDNFSYTLNLIISILFFICSFVFYRHAISLNRIEAYLALLKESIFKGDFFKGYSGWEKDLITLKELYPRKYKPDKGAKLKIEKNIFSSFEPRHSVFQCVLYTPCLLVHIYGIISFFSFDHNLWAIETIGVIFNVLAIALIIHFIYLLVTKYSRAAYKKYWATTMLYNCYN